jgi:hypothetical protein
MRSFVYELHINKGKTYETILNSEGRIGNPKRIRNEKALSGQSHFNVDRWHKFFQSESRGFSGT